MLTEPDAYVWNTANGEANEWILCWSKQRLVCVSLMASHLICGQTNYYITVLLTGYQMICNTGGNLWSAHAPWYK